MTLTSGNVGRQVVTTPSNSSASWSPYTGSRVTVWRYLYPWRKADALVAGKPLPAPVIRPPKPHLPSAREGVWLLLKAENKLSVEERPRRAALLQVEKVKQGDELVQRFRQLLAARKGEELDEWIKQVEATEGAPLQGFLHGLRRAEAAVRKAFTSPWSNGQTEGQVNRLKCIKRQMFGRAKFDWLKARGLNAPCARAVLTKRDKCVNSAQGFTKL